MNLRFWILSFAACGSALGCQGKAAPAPITLGHVGSLSGTDRRADAQASLGIRLALEEVNKDDEQRRILVRHTDTQGKLDAFESEAVRLLAVNQVDAFLGGLTPEEVQRLDRAVKPETEEKPIFVPIVSPSGQRTGFMSKQVILTGMTPQAQGKILARYAAEELKVSKVSILVDSTQEAMRSLAEAFAREFKPAIAGPIQVLSYGSGVKLIDLLARLDSGKPSVVLLAGSKGDLRLLREKWKPAKAKQPAIILHAGEDGSIHPGEWSSFFAKTDGLGETTIYLASAFGLEKDNATITDFADRFHSQFQEKPDVHAALAYEGTKLLADGLRRVAEPGKLREEFFKIKDFPGLAGPLNFDADQNLQRTLFILRLDRDQLSVMKKYAP